MRLPSGIWHGTGEPDGSIKYRGMDRCSLKKVRRDFGHAVIFIGILLYKLLFIDDKLKLQAQFFRGLSA